MGCIGGPIGRTGGPMDRLEVLWVCTGGPCMVGLEARCVTLEFLWVTLEAIWIEQEAV